MDHLESVEGPERSEGPASARQQDRSQSKFVSFYIGGKCYAVHASAVAEVTSPLSPSPLPDTLQRLRGIAPLRGEIVAVIDLGAHAAGEPAEKRKAVVLKSNDPENHMPLAFNVDRVGELLSIPPASIVPVDGDAHAGYAAELSGGTVHIIELSRFASCLTDH